MEEGGVKNPEKLLRSSMDAPLSDNKLLQVHLYDFSGPQHYIFLRLMFKIKTKKITLQLRTLKNLHQFAFLIM